MSLVPTIMTAASMANTRLRSPLLATASHDRTPVLRCIRRSECASSSHMLQAHMRLVPSHILGLRTHTAPAPARRTLTATSATDTRTSGNSTTAVQADGSTEPASQPGVSWVDWLLYVLAIALGTAGASAALVLYTGWEVTQAKDTLAAVRSEVTELRASSSADPGQSASATAEIKALRTALENLRAELKQEVQDLRGEIPGELQAVQAALQAEVQTLRTEVKTDRKVLRQGLKADIRDRKADINRLGVGLGKVNDRLVALEKQLNVGSSSNSGSVGAGEKVASAPAAAAAGAVEKAAEKAAPAAEKAAASAE